MHQKELSYLALEKQETDFPAHFHETYCISLICSGIEQLEINEQSHFAEAGSITVTHPYEVHSQPVINREQGSGFITIYLSEDLMRFYTEHKQSLFLDRRIINADANKALLHLKRSIDSQAKPEDAIRALIQALRPFATDKPFYEEPQSPWLMEVKSFISNYIYDKIQLDELAHIANLNKFGFSKTFKKETGMSPMSYVLMQKVFAAKDQIAADSNLTSIAYQFDFADMAHFSNTFKRFVGISPKEYKSRLII